MVFIQNLRTKLGGELLGIQDIRDDPATLARAAPTPPVSYPDDLILLAVGTYASNRSQRLDDVRAVAGELIANAINHGNQNDPQKLIRVECLWRKCFYLAITDEGPGFDSNNPPFIPGSSGIPPEGGLGLACSKQRSDRLYTDGSSVISIFRD